MAVPAARRPMEWRLCSWTRSSSANSHCSRTNKARAHVWFRKAILGCSWLTSSDRDLRSKPGCSHNSYTARSTERCPVEPLSSTCPFCGSRNVVERNPESRSKEELRPRRTRKVDSARISKSRVRTRNNTCILLEGNSPLFLTTPVTECQSDTGVLRTHLGPVLLCTRTCKPR